ncbi:hypothetical protein GCM10009737_12600 [Nocardioides lentus]|uniref:Uncharacterized protein n=1 Tax=Nocardioides lentus TaxID=338077 RepID=A0ABN2P5C4_9ACTN
MDPRTAYDEAASPQQMAHDSRRTGRRLRLLEQAARSVSRPAPDLSWEGRPREVVKPEITVDAAAARLAASYLD